MSVEIRVYNNSGDDYVDFEGESEECIKSMPEFQKYSKKCGWDRGWIEVDDLSFGYEYALIEGIQDKVAKIVGKHLKKGYEIQSTNVVFKNDIKECWHIVHLVKKK
jgi:hypothetical protein